MPSWDGQNVALWTGITTGILNFSKNSKYLNLHQYSSLATRNDTLSFTLHLKSMHACKCAKQAILLETTFYSQFLNWKLCLLIPVPKGTLKISGCSKNVVSGRTDLVGRWAQLICPETFGILMILFSVCFEHLYNMFSVIRAWRLTLKGL
jgi:hypothetical protein